MNRNALKIIACLTMLIDHIGFLFFPDLIWLRYIGRLSMPLFAFFIAEGCRYTSNKLRYFLQIFLLGVACQSVYIAEQAIFGAVRSFYLNILLTFSLSILLAYAYLYWEKNTESKTGKKAHLSAFLFIGVLLLIVGVCEACKYVDARTPYELVIDYGLPGILLPLAALISRDKKSSSCISHAHWFFSHLRSLKYTLFPGLRFSIFPSWLFTMDKKERPVSNMDFTSFIPRTSPSCI